MITFELTVGGIIKISSMGDEESGLIEMSGVGVFLQREIATSVGVHGCLAVQSVMGLGKIAIPNDIRFVLDEIGMDYQETKTKGFVEESPLPIPADEVR